MKTQNVILLVVMLGIGFASSVVASVKMQFIPFITSESSYGGAFLVFAGKNGGNIKMSELQGQTKLGVEGCAKGSRIFSFALEVNAGGKVRTFKAESNDLTNEMVTMLKGLHAGDSFEFKSMKAYLPDSKDVVDVHGNKFVVVKENASTK